MTISTITIDQATEVLIDYRGKTPEKSSSGIRLITAKVVKGGRILSSREEFIPEHSYESWMRRGLPRQWDILITTEAPLGEVAQLRTSERVALAQRLILLRGKPGVVDQGYFFQALKSPFVVGELASRSSGTTVLGIKQSELRKVRIPYFPLEIQKRIAGILSAYDDLIENNTRRIALLEEMAQSLYQEWFVRFRYPGHEEVPLVESAIGLVPEGWKISQLRDIAVEVRSSADPTVLHPSTPYVGLEHIPRKSIALSSWGSVSEVQSSKLRFRTGEILFGKIRPYFHKVCVASIDGVCSSDTIVIRPKSPEYFAATLSLVSSESFVNHASQTSQGTKMPRANWNVLLDFPIALPPSDTLARFDSFVSNCVEKIRNLVMQNRNLACTRDILLPKLVSGEIDLNVEITAALVL
jgi:type I restriction enzyme S subunit